MKSNFKLTLTALASAALATPLMGQTATNYDAPKQPLLVSAQILVGAGNYAVGAYIGQRVLGKRAVIEHISGSCGGNAADTLSAVMLTLSTGAGAYVHYLPLAKANTYSGQAAWDFNDKVRLYADGNPNNSVAQVNIARTSLTYSMGCRISISGYWADAQ